VNGKRVSDIAVRCFGTFALTEGDRPIDLSGVKPRARAVLRMLALHAGRLVHREVLTDALWPESDGDVGKGNLQVAVSTLRKALGDNIRVERQGDAYRLALPAGATFDLVAFDSLVDEGRASLQSGNAELAIAAYAHALSLYEGDLLSDDGPAEWVVSERERYRGLVVEAALAASDLLADRDPSAAMRACEQALRADRYSDALWRTFIRLAEKLGDAATAARARHSYEGVLAELGVS
jgi:DNA-binding SARP family transcriptional activator